MNLREKINTNAGCLHPGMAMKVGHKGKPCKCQSIWQCRPSKLCGQMAWNENIDNLIGGGEWLGYWVVDIETKKLKD